MGKSPHQTLEGARTDTDTEFITLSETTEHAWAQSAEKMKKGDTLEDASAMPSSKIFGGKKSASQQQIPKEVSSQPEQLIAVSAVMLAKHPELAGKSVEEQQSVLRSLGYVPSKQCSTMSAKPSDHGILVKEEMLLKHPELVGQSKSQQQQMLRELGYKPSVRIAVDEDMLAKHPELADMTIEEQQIMVKSLGSLASKQTTPSKSSALSHTKTESYDDTLIADGADRLASKSSQERKEMLKAMSYHSGTITPKISSLTSKDILAKSASKDPEARLQLLQQLGSSGHSIVISKELLAMHPELIDKSPELQIKLLEDLGYPTDEIISIISEPFAVDEEVLKKHPELLGIPLEEQKKRLTEMGYILDEVLKDVVPTSTISVSKDLQVICKAPCKGKKPSDFVPSKKAICKSECKKSDLRKTSSSDSFKEAPSKVQFRSSCRAADNHKNSSDSDPSKGKACKAICRSKPSIHSAGSRSRFTSKHAADNLERQLSSREVSISCKAPCRSAATLHATSIKTSEKNIGDAPKECASNSRSISLQKKPSSRDDSASCKASCRTISIQSSKSKSSKKEIKDLVAVRSESTTSSSTYDNCKDKPKKKTIGLTEVPSIVSQLSDKERPAIPCNRKPKCAKKRRSKAVDSNAKKLEKKVRSCDCPPAVMMPQMVFMPPMQMSYSMPPTGHAANCRCDACLNNYESVNQNKKPGRTCPGSCFKTSELPDSPASHECKAKKKLRHPPTCECVDCLCLPKVKKIASTVEPPIGYNNAQVYQVKVKCDTCVNAQNARRYVEQQQAARSRIPISTTTPNPPKTRSETKQAASTSEAEGCSEDPNKEQVEQKLSSSDSIYNEISCDCPQCMCAECADSTKRPPPKIEGAKDCCCKKQPCECDTCAVDVLTKKLREAEEKLAAMSAPPEPAAKVPEAAPPAEMEGDGECTCTVCTCPRSDLMPGKEAKPSPKAGEAEIPGDAGDTPKPPEEEESCTCVECVCPFKDRMASSSAVGPPVSETKSAPGPPPAASAAAPPAGGGDDEECNCTVCECPGKMSLPVKPSATGAPGAGAPGAGAAPAADAAQAGGQPISILETCDCKVCKCSPCADPAKKAGADAAAKGTVADAGEPLMDCDCVECKCSPCADPKRGKGTIKAQPKEGGVHPPDCDCEECRCEEEIKAELQDIQAAGEGPHPDKCDCPVCVCPSSQAPPESEGAGTTVHGEGPEAKKSETKHGEDCTCPECKCPGEKEMAQKVSEMRSKATDMPEKIPHPPDCDCDDCRCIEEIIQTELVTKTEKGIQPPAEKEVHALGCACTECVCKECTTKSTHALGCKCSQCICVECDFKKAPSAPGAPGQAAGDHAATCTCIECACDMCSDPSKQKKAGAGAPGEKGAEAAGEQTHGDNCKCVECLCKECLMKLAPIKHDEGCQCVQCVCVECLKKMQQGDQDAVCGEGGGPGNKAAEIQELGILGEAGCTCDRCICIECKGKANMEMAAAQELIPTNINDPVQPCDCTECTCVSASLLKKMQDATGGPGMQDKVSTQIKAGMQGVPSITKHGEACNCEICQCVEEQELKEGSKGDTCTCTVCQCKPCFAKEKPPEICLCPICTCVVCDRIHPEQPRAEEVETSKGVTCTCTVCQCKPCFAKEKPPEVCACPVCTCIVCDKIHEEGQRAQASTEESGTHPSTCTCPHCVCGKDAQSQEAAKGDAPEAAKGDAQPEFDPPLFEPPTRVDCQSVCKQCDCIICAAKETEKVMETKNVGTVDIRVYDPDYVAPPFEVPVRIDCICNRCSCTFCNKEAPLRKDIAAQPSMGKFDDQKGMCAGGSTIAAQKSTAVGSHHADITAPPAGAAQTEHLENCTCDQCQCDPRKLGKGEPHPDGCECEKCVCQPCKFHDGNTQMTPKESKNVEADLTPKESTLVEVIKPATHTVTHEDMPLHCNCPTCTCAEDVIQTTSLGKSSGAPSKVPTGQSNAVNEQFQSADTIVLPKPDALQMYPVHPPDCDCVECKCAPCLDEKKAKESVKAMDDVSLVKSIQAANKENCECKEQIEEIKRTLEKIRCACTEAEFRSTQSMAQTMGKEVGPLTNKPFVKQASHFGQTMSGLKMALNNLQSKCKAKDKMIEAMTSELAQRGNPEVFHKVLDVSVKLPGALDYDQGSDTKSLNRSQLATKVIYPPTEHKDEGTAACDLRCVVSKGVEVRTHKHKKKKSNGKKLDDCSCSKPQLVQKEEKDCQKLDLSGFEVVDIRRITDDSLIVKWNAPKSVEVQGYDIFVNGSIATKVMSGTRTSAMMHSLDLSKSVQITIYAVTKCGRVEPPAIAIYEIKG